MATATLGRTGITVNKNGFGALPIQRISKRDAEYLLRKAYDHGIHFFDTARMYTDSEEKIGTALSDVRDKIVIASKTGAATAEELWEHLEISLRLLKTDCIDIYQLHNPPFCPKPGDESGLYDAMLEAKRQGKIRFLGISNHRLSVAAEVVESGLYDTLQFPFCYLSGDKDVEIVERCAQKNIGFIAMKALSGGLITHSAAAYAFLAQYGHVLPIWGVQRENELDEFLSYVDNPPSLDDPSIQAVIQKDRGELLGNFCRACGYCMPCPVGIEINTCARMSLLIRRAPSSNFLTEEAQAMMHKIKDCTGCGRCAGKCPYGLNPSELLEQNYRDYLDILAGKVGV